jgi:O-methyltransferase domain/Dimerisation domain
MSEDPAPVPGGPPPPAVLMQMMTGYWVSQALYVAAKLGLADLVADGVGDVHGLAARTGADASSLHRVLRALASVGVFTEASPGSYGLTPLAGLLRTGTPDSMRALAIMYAEEQYRAWGELLHSVRTGEPAFDHQYGMAIFEYFRLNPQADQVFNEAMTGYTNQLVSAVVDAYDFSPFQSIVDVGGSYGTLLAAILQRNPNATGILFDQPHVVTAAADQLSAAGVAHRCTAVGGDFFVDVPGGCDAYLLAQILHDWDDERCVTILRQCRRVIADDGKLLAVELVLPEGEEPFFGKWLDLHMLVMSRGRERTAIEYGSLLSDAGFAMTRVVPTPVGPSIVEAIAV